MSNAQRVIVEHRGQSIGLSTLLLVLFVGLKLTDHIDWSWFWVLSPIWIPFAIVIAFLALTGVVILLGGAGAWIYEKIRGR